MPAVSKAQQKFMGICAHEPEKARGKCPSKKVSREFAHKETGAKLPKRKKAGVKHYMSGEEWPR